MGRGGFEPPTFAVSELDGNYTDVLTMLDDRPLYGFSTII